MKGIRIIIATITDTTGKDRGRGTYVQDVQVVQSFGFAEFVRIALGVYGLFGFEHFEQLERFERIEQAKRSNNLIVSNALNERSD